MTETNLGKGHFLLTISVADYSLHSLVLSGAS